MKKYRKLNIIIFLAALCVGAVFLMFFNTSSNAEKTEDTGLEPLKIKYAEKIKELKQLFVKEAVIKAPEIVDCVLSGGAQTACFSITVNIAPGDFTPGPWCPRHINDSAEDGGLWIKDGKTYDVDGAFVENLASFYDDSQWQMYNPETGNVNYTKTREACAAAARPDVDPQYQNHCVECRPDFMEEGASMSYVIPLEPVIAAKVENRPPAGIGVSFSGAKIETAAPLNAILDAHTLAPFDDCGGHVNLHVGYHIHAVTGCVKEIESDLADHAPMIGYAMDGYPLYMKDNPNGIEPDDLDECRGHTVEGLGYHYHAADSGKNAILPCLKAQSGCASENPDAQCDASVRKGPPF